MNEKKLVQNFKSYINFTSQNNGEKNGSIQELKPKLLNGELIVGAAHSVVLLTPLSERDRGRLGSLFITNYKLAFVPIDHSPADESYQRNSLLGTFDVPLSAVDAVWLTDAGPVRRRRLLPYGQMPSKVKGLQVICKNMKVMTFSFANSPIDKGRLVAMAIIHHAFPKRHHLLFAYDYREPYYPTLPHDMNMFLRPGDWKRELERCDCPHWRITCINGTSDGFMPGAGETLIVPSSMLDYNLIDTARHYRGGRVPVWTWGCAGGAALLRSGETLQTEQSIRAESVFLEQVRRSHPKLKPPRVMYLCGAGPPDGPTPLPPLAALLASYRKLVELCTPTTLGGFWVQDSQYYSILESSRWLRYVSSCLALADEAAHTLTANDSVVLAEGDGVDYCALVSCLTQLLLDAHSRTISGFQSLVQKEWVALGHPFCDRLGLLTPPNPKDQATIGAEQAPVFLLFLDCVWQLQQQFPSEFQFTETYLTTLWDCCHNQLFDTFLFNCPRDRELAVSKNFVLRPVWDWGEQFSEHDMTMFYNPLYASNKASNTPKQRISRMSMTSAAEATAARADRLRVSWSLASVEVWSQCYERWLLPMDATGAGRVQYHIHNMAVMQQVHRLKEKQISLSIMNRHSNGDPEPAEPPKRQLVPRFYPFSSSGADEPPRSLDSMQVSLIDASQLLDSQSLLNALD